ncbi:MAG: hypothetical protein LUH11_02300 [Candidatus Gastranaerophilales bacterium]|nr:hypothetical protein [Candidatus Gastranaerophilales bacterium]
MNEVLAKLEELDISDLNYILEYLIDLINLKCGRVAGEEEKCKQKNLKQ